MLHGIKNSTITRVIHNKILRPNWKFDFVSTLPDGARMLDVGCGNDSPYRYKTMRPRIHYTGLDIGNYNQTRPNLADDYIVTTPESFTKEISKRKGQFDAILSSHNLEHCMDRNGTVDAMAEALKPGGVLYLAFPSSASIAFPNRGGTLNYKDDLTHLDEPPIFDEIVARLKAKGLEITYATPQYKPFILRLIGKIREPRSLASNHVLTGTWEHWGFESIIWAKRPR